MRANKILFSSLSALALAGLVGCLNAPESSNESDASARLAGFDTAKVKPDSLRPAHPPKPPKDSLRADSLRPRPDSLKAPKPDSLKAPKPPKPDSTRPKPDSLTAPKPPRPDSLKPALPKPPKPDSLTAPKPPRPDSLKPALPKPPKPDSLRPAQPKPDSTRPAGPKPPKPGK